MKQRLLVMLAVVVVLTLTQVGTAHTDGIGKWTKDQQYMWGAYTLVWALDFGQTRDIAKRPDEYREKYAEAWLGRHPSVGRVNNMLVLEYVATYVASTQLESGCRTALLLALIVFHGTMVGNNNAVGLKVDWRF